MARKTVHEIAVDSFNTALGKVHTHGRVPVTDDDLNALQEFRCHAANLWLLLNPMQHAWLEASNAFEAEGLMDTTARTQFEAIRSLLAFGVMPYDEIGKLWGLAQALGYTLRPTVNATLLALADSTKDTYNMLRTRGDATNTEYNVFDETNKLVGSTVHAEDAAALLYGVCPNHGATIKTHSGKTLWHEGTDGYAGESYDTVAELCLKRKAE